MKAVKRKAKSAPLVWKDLGLTAGPRRAATASSRPLSGKCSTVTSSRKWMTAMCGISAASRGTAVLRNWTRPRPSHKRITPPGGIGETSLNARPPLPAASSPLAFVVRDAKVSETILIGYSRVWVLNPRSFSNLALAFSLSAFCSAYL